MMVSGSKVVNKAWANGIITKEISIKENSSKMSLKERGSLMERKEIYTQGIGKQDSSMGLGSLYEPAGLIILGCFIMTKFMERVLFCWRMEIKFPGFSIRKSCI